MHRLRLLDEHGMLHGWFTEEKHTPTVSKARSCDDSDADVGCQQGDHNHTITHIELAELSEVTHRSRLPQLPPAQDGNSDECAICGLGGLLTCCVAFPRACHGGCIGHEQPENDDQSD